LDSSSTSQAVRGRSDHYLPLAERSYPAGVYRDSDAGAPAVAGPAGAEEDIQKKRVEYTNA
jgi:hypothetical protein